jgi:site-specific DNA-methyltransferase (adenine-specific)
MEKKVLSKIMQLFNDDCLKVLPTIPDKSIDLILTDPPYGTTQCKWDSIIPFEPMWNQLKRVIKDNGCIALFGSEPFSSNLRMSNINNYKYDWIWQKQQGTNPLSVNYMPLKDYEIISIFYKTKPTYNPQMSFGKPYKAYKSTIKKIGEVYGGQKSQHRDNPKGSRFPKMVLYFKTERGLHPTQKPVTLLEYLIKTYTNENDTVLDFTMGSGSTGVACKNLNRRFIGIELEKNYFKIAKDRIESTLF